MPVGRFLDEQRLPTPAGADAAPGQLGRHDLGVVQHQPVTRGQQVRQVANMLVQNLLPLPVYDHQPGVCAVPQRLLGD